MKKAEKTEEGLLDGLERAVHAAAERIRVLNAENARLASRIEELEGEAAADSGEAAAWAEERDDVRRRVEALTETLEGLLADGAADE